MVKIRIPNCPSMSLGPALTVARGVFAKVKRSKMSGTALAKHIGYTSLHSRARSTIGSLLAFGFIEGSGNNLRITEDAVKVLSAPSGSKERAEALGRAVNHPPLFKELRKEFPRHFPSLDKLQHALIKRQFSKNAAEKAARSFLATINLVFGISDSSNISENSNTPLVPTSSRVKKAEILEGERELAAGKLTSHASFRLIVRGNIGVKQIERLIKRLEREKKILASQSRRSVD